MLFFIFFIMLVALFSFFDSSLTNYRELRAFIFFILVSFSILISGFREPGVGADDFSYLKIFSDIPELFSLLFDGYSLGYEGERIESGFVYYISALKQFGVLDEYLFLFSSILSVSLTAIFYYKISPLYILSFLVFSCHFFIYRDMNQIRAAISCGFGGLFLLSMYRNNLPSSLFFIGVSSLFHAGGMLYLLGLVYFIIPHLTRRLSIALVGVSMLTGAIGVTSIVIGLFPDIGRITTKIVNYSNSDRHGYDIGLFDITNLKNLAILSFGVIYWKRLEKNEVFPIVWFFMVMNTCWRMAFSDFAILAARGATFFAIVEPVLIAIYIATASHKKIITFAIILYSLLMFYLNISVKEIISWYDQIVI